MKKLSKLFIGLVGIGLVPIVIAAQEPPPIEVEESAEVFLEEYTDEFQENFFEALKQKGIENYDKAINLFLECKRLDGENPVVDHELAVVYLADKQYLLAQQYSLEAIHADPANYWYLDTLVEIVERQGSIVKTLEQTLPYSNEAFKKNLALIYFRKRKFENSLDVLKELKSSVFSKQLTSKIKDSLDSQKTQQLEKEVVAPTTAKEDPIAEYKLKITDLIQQNEFPALLQLSSEALESFPTQPFFYYAHGLALHKKGNAEQAVEVLESALDYLLDDADLADKIYRVLAAAHTSLGNSSKANMYLSKIKSGS